MNAPDRLVAAAAERLFANLAPADSGFDAVAWEAFRAGGFAQVLALSDGDLADAAGVMRAAGYHAIPAPVCEATLSAWLAARAGLPEEDGLATIVLDGASVCALGADGSTVSGELEQVPCGRHATAVYVPTPEGGLLRVALNGGAQEEGENIAGEPRDRLVLVSAPALPAGGTRMQDALAMAALLRAAQMAGAMERALDLALEHAGTRTQFGRAIGKFQAVQQMLAVLAAHAAAATAAVDLATGAYAREGSLFEAAVAKSRAGEAAGVVCEAAHQVIAAMGFTREHPLHRVTRRLWAWRDEFGNETWWNTRIGAAVFAVPPGGVWPMIADGTWSARGVAP